MPLVSVVLPAFNAADTIGAAARSILAQTLRDLELIVIDDGSTDATPAVVRGIDDSRVRLIRQEHQGVAAAANLATHHATAGWIARMDADDFSHPRRLARQLELATRHDLDAVGCQVRIVDHEGRDVPSLERYRRWINEETLDEASVQALRFVEMPLVNPTIFARRRYFALGFRGNDLPEDYDLLLRAAAAGMRLGKAPEVLFEWVDRPGRLTRTDQRYSAEAFLRCRRSHLLRGPLHNVNNVDLWGAGQTGKPWLRWLPSQGIAVRRAYEVNERKLGETIHGVGILHPDQMPPADGTPLLIAVGADGARALILPHLAQRGYVPGRDAWFVA